MNHALQKQGPLTRAGLHIDWSQFALLRDGEVLGVEETPIGERLGHVLIVFVDHLAHIKDVKR